MSPMGGPANSQPLVRLGSQSPSFDPTRRVKINVGGRIFESTLGTLQASDKGTNLFKRVYNSIAENSEVFFDRDPEPFAILLSALRTGQVDEKDREGFNLDQLIREANFYGLLDQLKRALHADPLDGIDVEKLRPIIPSGLDYPSALAADVDGSLWVGHGSKITTYDWALRKARTTVTELNTVKLLNRVSETQVAVGADDFPGLHVYNAVAGTHTKSITWEDADDPRVYNSVARAISSNDSHIFASFEAGNKLDNTLLLVDMATFEIRELGRQNGNTGHSRVATKLQWLPEKNLLLVGASHGGAFGYSGYIRLWDVRQEKIVWDWEEPNYRNPRVEQRDVFADMVANEELAGIFKVSINSGTVAMADLRRLDATDPWLTLTETNPALVEGTQVGADNKVITYNSQLYVSRGGNLEVWSEVPLAESFKDISEKEYWESSFRRNFVDYRRHTSDPITNLAVGGDRLFVTRKDHQAVEVWETRR